jgi:RHS repeat-associated protein
LGGSAPYDGLNRLTRLRNTTASATLTDEQYAYDTANRISQLTDLGGNHAYSYDSVDRVTSATYSGAAAESYIYDGVGNRTASHLSASYTYQPFNRVTSAGGATYTYDNNGNLLSKVSGTDTTQYAWDYENRLTQVTLPNGTVINYKYDALGRRIQRTTSAGADERYVYDGQNVIQDLNSSSSVVTSYLNGPGLDNHLRQTNSSNGTSYFLTDHLGSTVGLTDASGNLTESIGYDSFGNHVVSTNTRYTYTGRERDPDTGLMYYRARFYDPQVGRFLSEDPLGFGGGDINLYGYVWQSPLRSRDPLGLDGGLAPSDIADVADKGLQTIQGYLQALNPDAVDRNTIINFVANNLYGMHDLLRVGRGVGSYWYGCGSDLEIFRRSRSCV